MDESSQDSGTFEIDEADQTKSNTENEPSEGETLGSSDAPFVDNGDPREKTTPESNDKPKKRRKKKRTPNKEAAERRLLGRQALCKRIEDLAPHMLKTVKLRILGQFLDSTKGLDDLELANRIKKDARKLADKKRIVEIVNTIDPDVNRRNLKKIIIHAILLQEEAYSLEERRLEEKVIEFEKAIVKRAKSLDFFDRKKHDPIRWHHYDTYRIVLEAAWRNDDDISYDEAALLRVLRDHLNISREEHWLIGAYIKKFPKNKCAIHTPDEIHEARKQLQKESVLWSYRDQNNRNIDVLPAEIVSVIRQEIAQLELQRTNYRRMLQHDSIRLSDLRAVLKSREMDHNGNKSEIVERIINGDVKPSAVLDELDKTKVSSMCSIVGLKSSGNKPDLIERVIAFYDDLTFEERETKDARETSYNNYELLASRSYADLRAKKLISKDLEIEHQFEKATDFLIEVMLKVKIDISRRVTKADGRIPLDGKRVILWDCKSAEKPVDLQDYLDDQFDGYMRKEAEKGTQPLAFLVIAPSFTPQSIKLAHRYKARTNWDIALIQADALKYLAEQWNAMEPEKPFPINLLNRTEIIDRERVEFLLSLA